MFNSVEQFDSMLTVHFAFNSVESTALFNESEPCRSAFSWAMSIIIDRERN